MELRSLSLDLHIHHIHVSVSDLYIPIHEERRERDLEMEKIADRFVATLTAACSKKKKRKHQLICSVKLAKYIFCLSWGRQLCPP
jgi:hypothetical protein